MRVLLDNNLDHRFGRLLPGHEVVHARWQGWAGLRNGDLVAAAEHEGFDVLVTGDKNMRYQQNLAERRISIVTLNSRLITLIDIAPLAPAVLRALDGLPQGAFVTIDEREGSPLPRCIFTLRTCETCEWSIAEAITSHLAAMRERVEPIPSPSTQVGFLEVAA